MIHKLKFHAYHFTGGDRLFEGVMFVADVSVNEDVVEIGEIYPHDDSLAYANKIKWEQWVNDWRERLQYNADHTVKWAQEQKSSFEQEMKKFEEEIDEPGIQILLEV